MAMANYGRTELELGEERQLEREIYATDAREQQERDGWAQVHADRTPQSDHQRRIALFMKDRDDQIVRARRVSEAGVEATLRTANEYIQTLDELKCLTEAEHAEAITAVGEIVRDLLAYQQTYHPRPVEIRRTGPRQSW